MEIILLSVVLIVQTGMLYYFIYLLSSKDKDEKSRLNSLLATHISSLEKTSTTFMQEISKVEMRHFEQLEKTGSKQLTILEKQTKDFLSAMTDFIKALKETPQAVPLDMMPHLLDNSGERNSIEKEEIADVPLSEIGRIPNINSLNIKFEDDEQILSEYS